MKLRKIKFKSHLILKDLEISFEDESGKILNTVVLIGNNGTGKTSILKGIFDNFEQGAIDEMDIEDKSIGKIVLMPTEINFDLSKKIDTRKQTPDTLTNIIDQRITSDVSSFIATKIETAVFANEDLQARESIRKTCDSINSIFACMDLNVRIVGLSKDDKKQPVFENKNKDTFPMDSLSSGEKQLFLRVLSLKFLNINDSIILIDEPGISLNPEWQRKIISVYESIGTNNQLIVATHSPYIIGDIGKEQIRVLKHENKEICMVPME
ncbi:MAG: AAA family ATPase [Eubacteriales bacterium]